ncbi:MAG TPA: YmdB family metallophosphoesterase [candidate division WWE3 bacterium]|uniref:YmdB family metallophosphoesterase n=1 Tax=candidate division WWE3 bacterium TaxID=2053526 RepID=A0A7C1NMR8_UNCKA|nr:YmdB family metallophosphoesterase [candidate division WWE3 bacterium]
MRILFIGDIVGKLGRNAVSQSLPGLKTKEGIDFAVANAENVTHGRGAKIKHLRQLKSAGVDFFTSGDHIFHIDPEEPFSDPEIDIIRPANYSDKIPGVGYKIVEVSEMKVAILNLLGLTYLGDKIKEDGRNAWIEGEIENPFVTAEKLLEQLKDSDVVLVDFHAEVTSEKRAMGFFLDGKVTAVLGTHTHVPTADPTILPKGTGYISDIGMTGARDSVLGVEPQIIIDRLKGSSADSFEWVEKGVAVLRSVIVDFDSKGLVKGIRRLDLEVS